MNKRSQAKMKDVAERAGVSLMTVSLALRTDQTSNRLSAKTREKILRIARELSYSPNARGRVLRSGVTNVIGLYAGHGFVNVRLPFFTEVVSGLQDGCEKYGKDLLLHGTFRHRSTDEIYAELRDGRIDGLVVNLPAHHPLASLLADSHLPVVALADALPQIPSIIVDDEGGGHLIAAHLAERDYKKCLYIPSSPSPISATRRRKGFMAGAQKHGLKVEEYQTDPSQSTENILKDLMARNKTTRPEVIVCWNDKLAYDFLAQCRHHKIDVPDEIAIIGFDGSPTPYDHFWSLSTVRAPWANAARMAVEQLNHLISGEEIPEETTLPVEMVTGHAT